MNLPTLTPADGYKIAFWLLLVGGIAFWLHHSGYESGVADTRAELAKADDANRTSQATIASLQMSNATCEIGRVLDRAAQTQALADRDKRQAATNAKYAAAKKRIDDLMGGQCAGWGKQPACGSVP